MTQCHIYLGSITALITTYEAVFTKLLYIKIADIDHVADGNSKQSGTNNILVLDTERSHEEYDFLDKRGKGTTTYTSVATDKSHLRNTEMQTEIEPTKYDENKDFGHVSDGNGIQSRTNNILVSDTERSHEEHDFLDDRGKGTTTYTSVVTDKSHLPNTEMQTEIEPTKYDENKDFGHVADGNGIQSITNNILVSDTERSHEEHDFLENTGKGTMTCTSVVTDKSHLPNTEMQTEIEPTKYDENKDFGHVADGNGIQSGTNNILVSDTERSHEEHDFLENTGSTSKFLKHTEPCPNVPEPFNLENDTVERGILIEDEKNVTQTREIKHTSLVIDGQDCTVTDENETEESVRPNTLVSQPNFVCSHSDCISQTEIQDKVVKILQEQGCNLVTEGNGLESEVTELEKILKACKRNNEMYTQKRKLLENIKTEQKQIAALKAAISDGDSLEEKSEQQYVDSLEDMVQYIAPGRCRMSLDFRDKDVPATLLPASLRIDPGIKMPVKLYDVEQDLKDSTFYSECNFD
ncbi:uncharacterized protein LOC123558144 [Mercenaria mercenaria]|uniref:uncharacterized protein LOC123558144 n=1 Tax=Mercenaria mercenaria TaxID=6596 RepID=UPI00234E7F66|nr:uncharacterized protein LOC123558144 [Mercenaria mercenaria]